MKVPGRIQYMHVVLVGSISYDIIINTSNCAFSFLGYSTSKEMMAHALRPRNLSEDEVRGDF